MSRKQQYSNLIVAIRLLGAHYSFTTTQYNLISGFWVAVDDASTFTRRSLIENISHKFIGPSVKIAPIKQKISIYVRKPLSVFENDIDPEHPEYKVKTTVSYNGNNFKLMSQEIIMESIYCYVGQLENS